MLKFSNRIYKQLKNKIMRKVTKETVAALVAGVKLSKGNTQVKELVETLLYSMELHGNKIAELDRVTGELTISDCGWKSVTTKERLNGILDYFKLPKITQKNYVWYIGDEVWNGTKVFNVQKPLV